jgi:hypothetical protein
MTQTLVHIAQNSEHWRKWTPVSSTHSAKGKPIHQQNVSNITTTMIVQNYVTLNIHFINKTVI